MKLSVIIPVYNEERIIGTCLISLLEQDCPNFEIVVVDDGSRDNTTKIIEEICSNSKKVKLFRQKHLGPGQARNFGVKKSLGEILVFVDADMTFHRNFLKNLVKPIIAGESKGTFSLEEFVSNSDNIWAKCWAINDNSQNNRRHKDINVKEQKVFRAILRGEFEKVKGFSKGGYTDDWSLSYKLGYLATRAQGALFYHQNPDSLKEVFAQSKWVAKREYKFGFLGKMITLFRSFFVISLMVGLIKSVSYNLPPFVIFKLVYDFGIFLGLSELLIFKRLNK